MSAPESLDLTAAAEAVVEESRTAGQGTALEGALAVWSALCGFDADPFGEEQALTYARDLANPDARAVTAQIAPF